MLEVIPHRSATLVPLLALIISVVGRADPPQADEAPAPGEVRPLPSVDESLLPKIESIKPQQPEPIPDDPPPHEGAMINLPLMVEPPDYLTLEVLEALPGRPITGERLVRPDGTISLGFYGDLQVRGLSPGQIKVKMILHLRTLLSDAALGLICPDPGSGTLVAVAPEQSSKIFLDISKYNSAP